MARIANGIIIMIVIVSFTIVVLVTVTSTRDTPVILLVFAPIKLVLVL